MPDAPDISVVVCSRDRPESLRRTLDSLLAMSPPAELSWELVVVDNGSTALSEAQLGDAANLSSFRLIREETPGIAHARNRGANAALGTFLCWTDDDVVVGSNWLAAYAAAFRRYSEATVFGGPIRAVLAEPAEPWAKLAITIPALAGFVSTRNFGPKAFALSPRDSRQPWGSNYAIRHDVQARFAYDPALGPSPTQARIGEETGVIAGALADGEAGWWVPDALVCHMIGSDRQTMTHFRSYYRRSGATAEFLRADTFETAGLSRLTRLPRPLLRVLRTTSGPIESAMFAIGWTSLALRLAARREFVAGLLGHA